MDWREYEPTWNCRVHPTDSFHEVGCPHRSWTVKELLGAIRTHKNNEQNHLQWISQLEQEIEKAREEGFKKGMENAWGMIDDILDTLDVDKNEEEINILIGILKVLDTEIIKLSKLTTK